MILLFQVFLATFQLIQIYHIHQLEEIKTLVGAKNKIAAKITDMELKLLQKMEFFQSFHQNVFVFFFALWLSPFYAVILQIYLFHSDIHIYFKFFLCNISSIIFSISASASCSLFSFIIFSAVLCPINHFFQIFQSFA